MLRKSSFVVSMIALMAPLLAAAVHAKDDTIYIGVDASTPPERTAVIRAAGSQEQTGKPKSIFNSQQKLSTEIKEIAESGHPESLISTYKHPFRFIEEVHVRSGRYSVGVDCLSTIATISFHVQVNAEAGVDYLIECIGNNPKYVQALVRPHLRNQQTSGSNADSPVDLSGVWLMAQHSDIGVPLNKLTLVQRGDRLSGRLELKDRTVKVSGTVNRNSFAFACTAIADGRKVRLEFAGEINGDELRGSMAYGDVRSIQSEWIAIRKTEIQSPDAAN